MFRTTSRPKNAVRVICNVAWASSIGGLAILAEERRRRVALAQKIIENGKRLQGYKAYTGVAALAEFDLGEEWDTRLPNVECEGITRAPGPGTLTNGEWRSRKRTHRSIPFISSLRSRQENASEEEPPTLQKHTPRIFQLPQEGQHSIRSAIQPLRNDSTSTVALDKRTADDQAAHDSSNSAPHVQKLIPAATVASPVSASAALPQHPLAYQLQLIVSRYVSDCLSSAEPRKREAGYRELAAFLEKSRPYCGTELRRVLRIAVESRDTQLEGNVAVEAYTMFKSALDTPNEPAPVSFNSVLSASGIVNKIWEHNSDHVPIDEQKFVMAIKTSLSSNQLENAFFGFLEMCQGIKRPLLSRSTRHVLRQLTSAYKSVGLVSVVAEIHNKILRVFKEWRLLYADIDWLLDQGLPEDNLKFTLELFKTLQTFKRLGPDSFAHVTARLVGWFVQHCHAEQAINLFVTIADSGKVSLNTEHMQQLSYALYGQTVEASQFELARSFLDQLLARGFPLSEIFTQVHKHVMYLIQHDRLQDAAMLYLTSLRAGTERAATLELFETYTMACPPFADTVFNMLENQIQTLHADKNYQEIVRLSELVPDVSKLAPNIGFLVYHANALAGPVIEAERIIDDLAKSQIPLWADYIHDSHSAYINRCWKQTGNFELTQKLFKKVQTLGFQQSAAIKTLNVMMHACVEAGHPEQAQQYFDQMLKDGRLEPNIYTWANLMLAKAVAEDWEAIPRLLRQAQSLGILPKKGGFDGLFFDKVFTKYCCHHDASEILGFGIWVMDINRASITQSMSNSVVDAAVKVESIELLTRWTEHMHSRGYEMSVGKESVSRILHRIMQSKRLKFQPILREAHELHLIGNTIDIPELLDRLNAVNAKRHTGAQDLLRPKSKHESKKLTQRAMLRALTFKQPAEALQLYQQSLVHGLPRQPLDLKLAVKASLQLNDGVTEEAKKLIENARISGLNTENATLPLILHDLQMRPLTYEEAHDMVFGYYRSVDDLHATSHHYLTLAVARNLSTAGNSVGALRILKDISDSEWGQSKPFDLPLLTITARLLLEQRQVDGVEWVVNTVLDRNLRIDKTFIRTLKQHGLYTRLHSRPGEAGRSQESDDEFREAIAKLVEVCRKRRAQQRTNTLKFAQDTVSLLQRQKQGKPLTNLRDQTNHARLGERKWRQQ